MRLGCCCSTSEDGRKEHGIHVLFARVSTRKANSAPSCSMQVERNHHFSDFIFITTLRVSAKVSGDNISRSSQLCPFVNVSDSS